LLASGGGTADRCIKFWNTHTGACLNSIDTQSQVLYFPQQTHWQGLSKCQQLSFIILLGGFKTALRGHTNRKFWHWLTPIQPYDHGNSTTSVQTEICYLFQLWSFPSSLKQLVHFLLSNNIFSVCAWNQVCALQWSKHERELLSSHGFSQNQLCLWKYPSMVKIAELTGHTSRVLHLAQVLYPILDASDRLFQKITSVNITISCSPFTLQSPDGYTVASAAGDETLRFWKVFGNPETSKASSKAKSKEVGSVLNSLTRIR
jgi:WD40 repeat protein